MPEKLIFFYFFPCESGNQKEYAAGSVKQWSNKDRTGDHRFDIPETGMVIMFCVFGTDFRRHTVYIMTAIRGFRKPFINFHAVVPTAPDGGYIQRLDEKRKNQKPEKKYFFQADYPEN